MYKTIQVKTNKRNELVDITNQVQSAVSSMGMDDGLCLVYAPHTTAGITINEGADPTVKEDIITAINSFNFEKLPFRHSEGNSDSHSKSTLVGASETIIIDGGRLVLGTWQSIYFCEFDGPRSRKVYIKTV
jgi:secondary thiamine-phosphate synthase enzyme